MGSHLAAQLAGDDDHLALAGLVDLPAPVLAVHAAVGGLDVAAEVGAIHSHFAADLGQGLDRAERFPDLVGEREGHLVLHVQIAAQLERGVALGAVHEDGGGGQNVADRQLASDGDRARSDAELVAALGALKAAVVA